MESIERLREYINGTTISTWTRNYIDQHIDAIEREVEDELKAKDGQMWLRGYGEGYDAGFASTDDWAAQHEDAMAEHGWVRLPVDAEGEVIHIGELVDEKLPFGGYAPPAPIDTMELSRGASGYRWMVKLDAENRALVSPKLLRHHRAPTVEDVLREFAAEVETAGGVMELPDAAFAEYAAKLALRGDE